MFSSNTELVMEGTDPAGEKGTTFTTSNMSTARRKRAVQATFALLLLLVLMLLVAVIYLASSCGGEPLPPPPPPPRRPLESWRSGGQCPPVPSSCPSGPPPLLVISLDGFRADYISRGITPMLKDMRDCGVSTPYVRSSFPSMTFPNHFSIVTGMYPESHGIVGNTIYDPELPGRKFKIGSPESFRPEWWIGEPIWHTVRKMGGISAVFFWVGSEVPDQLPTYYRNYDQKVPFEDRVDQIVKWLLLPEEKRPRYLSLYFHEPDKQGHGYGPDSEPVDAAIDRVDRQLANLYNQLIEHDLLGCVDVVVVSDHGMAAVREDCGIVALDDYSPGLSNHSQSTKGPLTRVRPTNESSVDYLVEQLDCAHPALRVMHRDELPERWHYRQSGRIEPIIATVDQGYSLSVKRSDFCIRGMHGYDNDLTDMRSFFVGHGPSFKQNFTTEPFENIQLYSLFQTLLELPDRETNATRHSLDHLLVNPPKNLSLLGEARGARPNMPDGLENPCVSLTDNCSAEALKRWTSGEPSTDGGQFPPPISRTDGRMDTNRDGSFLAEVSGSEAYRWLQYRLERDVNDNLLAPALSELDGRCLFVRGGRLLPTADKACTEQEDYVSLVHTPGTTTYWERMWPTRYPMYGGYRQRVLPEIRRRLSWYSEQYRAMVVLAGPVYRTHKLDRHGRRIPSHFFYQLRMCSEPNCSVEEIKHKQWILPHKDNFRSCEDAGQYVDFHEATLRDIERVSGLTLFADQTVSQPRSAQLSHARFITQLPEFQPPQGWGRPAAKSG